MITKDLSEDFVTLELYPLSDVHIGDMMANMKEFDDFIKQVQEEENRYLVLTGDIINNNLKSSVGSVYEDVIPPSQQKKHARRLLEPVRDRILLMVSGNHEHRTKKDADQDITEEMADHLGVSYREEEAVLKLRFGKRDNTKKQTYIIYITHGWSGGRRPGSTLNNLEDLSRNIFANIYIVGHSHKRIGHKALYLLPDLRTERITEVEQLYVSSASWLDYGGYAARKTYRPQVRGSAPIVLYAKEKKAWAMI